MYACKISDDYTFIHGTIKGFKRFLSWIHKKIGRTYLKGTFIGMSASVTSGGYTIFFRCLLIVKKGSKPTTINYFTFASRGPFCIKCAACDAFRKKWIIYLCDDIRCNLIIRTTFQARLFLLYSFSSI